MNISRLRISRSENLKFVFASIAGLIFSIVVGQVGERVLPWLAAAGGSGLAVALGGRWLAALRLRRRAALLDAYATRLQGSFFRKLRTDQVQNWLSDAWPDRPSMSELIGEPDVGPCAGVQATFKGDPFLIVGVRRAWSFKVDLVMVFAVPQGRPGVDPTAEARLGQLGYQSRVWPHGIVLRRWGAPLDAFRSDHLDLVLRTLWNVTHIPEARPDEARRRERSRQVTIDRWTDFLSFSAADLQLNSRGLMTRHQRLRQAGRGLAQLVVALAVAATARLTWTTHPATWSGVKVGYDVLVQLAISFGLAWFGLRSLHDAVEGHVDVAVGCLAYRMDAAGVRSIVRYLDCGDLSFRIEFDCSAAIEPGVPYQVYFNRKRILSLERNDP
jgi:hypothetical protein